MPRFGIFVPQGWRHDLAAIPDPVEQFEAMVDVARRADAQSWDSVWVYDHFHTVPDPTANTTFECWTSTAALARETSRVRVGQMVGCNGYRNPALYAKTASTVDVMSNGRLYAGIGAGWYEHEWKAYGYEWPSLKDRMRSFAEAVELIDAMWTTDRPTFNGRYHRIDQPYNEPKGAHGKPSLWIGGGGEKVTLKLVAKYGDAANIGGGDPETFAAKNEILDNHCRSVGRDGTQIIRSTSLNAFPIDAGDDPERATETARGDTLDWDRFAAGTLVGTDDEIADRIEQLVAAGCDYVILYVAGLAYDSALLDRMAAITGRF